MTTTGAPTPRLLAAGRRLEIAGQKFSRLTAIERQPGGKTLWKFRCDCGSEVIKNASYVKNGNIKSCGCLNREALLNRNKTHGLSTHPLYMRWAAMIARCSNENHVAYKSYGARGIKVCERWKKFECFLEDMGMPESLAMTIEREDNDGDYCKENCKWASRKVQSRNTSRNVNITIDGVTKTVRDWEVHAGVKRGVFQRRIDIGWSHEKAITIPVMPGVPLRSRE